MYLQTFILATTNNDVTVWVTYWNLLTRLLWWAMWPMGLVFLNMEPVLLVLREPIDDKNIHYRAPLMCYEYIYIRFRFRFITRINWKSIKSSFIALKHFKVISCKNFFYLFLDKSFCQRVWDLCMKFSLPGSKSALAILRNLTSWLADWT